MTISEHSCNGILVNVSMKKNMGERVDYGSSFIKYLSGQLQPEFERSFSTRQIDFYRQLYHTFEIVQTLYAQLSYLDSLPYIFNYK